MVDSPARFVQDQGLSGGGVAVLVERDEQLPELPTGGRRPPERLDMGRKHEDQFVVTLVEIASIAIEMEHPASRPPVAEADPDRVNDAELRVELLLVTYPLPLAPIEAIGKLLKRAFVPIGPFLRCPVLRRDVWWRHRQRVLVRAPNVGSHGPLRPVELLVGRKRAVDERGEPVEQLRRQRLGSVGVMRVRYEREHALEIPRA